MPQSFALSRNVFMNMVHENECQADILRFTKVMLSFFYVLFLQSTP